MLSSSSVPSQLLRKIARTKQIVRKLKKSLYTNSQSRTRDLLLWIYSPKIGHTDYLEWIELSEELCGPTPAPQYW